MTDTVGHLYFMRHGETALNRRGVFQGRIDAPLSGKGVEQASETGDHIRSIGLTFDAVFCSPLGRARQTLEAALPDQAYQTDASLQEIDFGSLDGTPNSENLIGPYGDYFKRFGGESEDDACERICSALDAIMSVHAQERVLVVSHGTMGRLFSARWSDGGAPEWLPNCCLIDFSYDAVTRAFSYQEMYTPDSAAGHAFFWTEGKQTIQERG